MITKEEYLKAKAIVDEYEQQEWEDDPMSDLVYEEDKCDFCDRYVGHDSHCPYHEDM